MAETLQLEQPLTDRAKADVAFLAKHLGRRFLGVSVDARGPLVTARRADGKLVHWFAPTVEQAVAEARRELEPLLQKKGVAGAS